VFSSVSRKLLTHEKASKAGKKCRSVTSAEFLQQGYVHPSLLCYIIPRFYSACNLYPINQKFCSSCGATVGGGPSSSSSSSSVPCSSPFLFFLSANVWLKFFELWIFIFVTFVFFRFVASFYRSYFFFFFSNSDMIILQTTKSSPFNKFGSSSQGGSSSSSGGKFGSKSSGGSLGRSGGFGSSSSSSSSSNGGRYGYVTW